MKNTSTVLSTLLERLPVSTFERAVKKYKGDKNVRKLTCFDLLKTLMAAQLTGMMSVRDMLSSLNAHGNELYHLGLKNVCRSTFCDALNTRPSEPFAELFNALAQQVLALK